MISAAGRISSTRPALCPASTLPHSTSPSSAACFRLERLEDLLEFGWRGPGALRGLVFRREGVLQLADRQPAAADERGLVHVCREHGALVVLVHARFGRGDEARAELHRIGAEREQRRDAGAVGDAAARHDRQLRPPSPRGAPAPACRPRTAADGRPPRRRRRPARRRPPPRPSSRARPTPRRAATSCRWRGSARGARAARPARRPSPECAPRGRCRAARPRAGCSAGC